jgi:hypothetical protein
MIDDWEIRSHTTALRVPTRSSSKAGSPSLHNTITSYPTTGYPSHQTIVTIWTLVGSNPPLSEPYSSPFFVIILCTSNGSKGTATEGSTWGHGPFLRGKKIGWILRSVWLQHLFQSRDSSRYIITRVLVTQSFRFREDDRLAARIQAALGEINKDQSETMG